MITTKTVLVLGAGASAPYGFPTGSNLVELIADDFSSSRVRRVEKTMPRAYRDLVDRLRKAQPDSIDEFLENHPCHANIGRRAIALHLLPAERESRSRLADLNKKDHWYRYLKARMSGRRDAFGQNALRIITFNYDRSLEYYLYETLLNSYERIEKRECIEWLKQLPILHIYGSLGPLDWQSPVEAVHYGGSNPEPPEDEIGRAGENIRILYDRGDAVQQNFKRAQEWLGWADRILFLGVGFHRDNVARLAFHETLRGHKEIKATCKGLDLTSRWAVEFCTPGTDPHAMGSPRSITFPDPDADCYTLLHDHVVLS